MNLKWCNNNKRKSRELLFFNFYSWTLLIKKYRFSWLNIIASYCIQFFFKLSPWFGLNCFANVEMSFKIKKSAYFFWKNYQIKVKNLNLKKIINISIFYCHNIKIQSIFFLLNKTKSSMKKFLSIIKSNIIQSYFY